MANEDNDPHKPSKFRRLFETPKAMAAFRSEYGVPNNVGLKLAPLGADRDTGSWDRMLIPIFAIVEGGVCFPFTHAPPCP